MLHSTSIFPNANNVVVRGGNFYCVGRDLLMAHQGERSRTLLHSKGSDDNISMHQILIELQRVLLKELKWYVSDSQPILGIPDPPAPSFLPRTFPRSEKFIKVQGIGSMLPTALPRQGQSRSSCMKEVVLKR